MTTVGITVAARDDTVPGRPTRPGGAAYWARVKAIAEAAPPLTDEQRATIRIAIHSHSGTNSRRAA